MESGCPQKKATFSSPFLTRPRGSAPLSCCSMIDRRVEERKLGGERQSERSASSRILLVRLRRDAREWRSAERARGGKEREKEAVAAASRGPPARGARGG
jgi:hypothetical protein